MPSASKSAKKTTAKNLPFSARLKSPDATLTLHSFGVCQFSVTLDASSVRGKVSDFGFVTGGPSGFQSILSQGCAVFMGKSPEEVGQVSFEQFCKQLSISTEERAFAWYAWTILLDVVSRLPFNDPLSKALGKISRLHAEFPIGEMGMDSED